MRKIFSIFFIFLEVLAFWFLIFILWTLVMMSFAFLKILLIGLLIYFLVNAIIKTSEFVELIKSKK